MIPNQSLCTFSKEEKSSDIIAKASKILLDHQEVAILGVQQGKSLESAYIALTS